MSEVSRRIRFTDGDPAAGPTRRGTVPTIRLEDTALGNGMTAIGKVLQLDPFLIDDYVDYTVTVHDDGSGSIEFHDSAGLADNVNRSPLDWLDGFAHMAQAVNPQCVVTQTGDRSWDLRIDPDAEPVQPHWLAESIGGGGLRDFDLAEKPVHITSKPS